MNHDCKYEAKIAVTANSIERIESNQKNIIAKQERIIELIQKKNTQIELNRASIFRLWWVLGGVTAVVSGIAIQIISKFMGGSIK